MIHRKLRSESLASFDHMRDLLMPRKIRAEAASGFGERLATLRKAADVTQTAMAEEIDISQRMMAYYEGKHPWLRCQGGKHKNILSGLYYSK